MPQSNICRASGWFDTARVRDSENARHACGWHNGLPCALPCGYSGANPFIFHNNFLTIFFDSKLPQWGGGGNAQVSMLIQIHLINLFGTNPVDSKRADRESQSLSGLM